MIPALGIFAVTYLLISKPRWPIAQLDRPTAGLIGAVLMIAAGLLTPEQAYHAIDWDTIVLLLGMLVLSGSLRLTGFFEWAAAVVLTHVRTPIALIERSDLPVLPYRFALTIGANIGSVMTVVGNPQNTIFAHAAPLSYVEFARVLAPIGVVNLGLTAAILRGIFRQDLQRRTIVLRPSVTVALDRALFIKTGVCLALMVAGFVCGLQLAWTALGGATLLLLTAGRPPRQLMAQVDGPLLLFFGALFMIIAASGPQAPDTRVHVGRAVVPCPRPLRHRPLFLGLCARVQYRLQRPVCPGGSELGWAGGASLREPHATDAPKSGRP